MKTRIHLSAGNVLASIGLFLLFLLVLSAYSRLKLPEPAGPYRVGRATLRWIDLSRPEVMTEAPNDSREVTALIWYPAEAGVELETEYFPGLSSLSDTLAQSGELAWWEVQGLRFVRSTAQPDAKPLANHAPYPVVLLSPGNGTNVEFYSILAGEIASHGYVVVGLNHPYDVPAVQLSDGRVAPYNKGQWSLSPAAHQAYSTERIQVRSLDAQFVLDRLHEVNSNAGSPFAGLLDLDSVAAAGHSLGGITASEACKADVRFKACINFDGIQRGGPFSMEETAIPPEQPFLFLTKESQLHPKLLERFESTSESYWVVVHGASHDSFTDGPLLRSSVLPVPGQADEVMRSIREYTLTFLDQTLKGESSSLLSETVEGADVSVRAFPSGE